jgi:hypothetical protein
MRSLSMSVHHEPDDVGRGTDRSVQIDRE